MGTLSEKRIAVLAEDGFEEIELTSPRQALIEAEARVEVVSPKKGSIRAKQGDEWRNEIPVDKQLEEVSVEDYDGLVLPGGVISPDKLRTNEKAINFVRDFFRTGKPVAAICHGPQILIDAEVVEGRKLTSVAAIRKDLINAGANWEDLEVVVDQGLVTSRKPADLPVFNAKMVEEFAEGKHAEQSIPH